MTPVQQAIKRQHSILASHLRGHKNPEVHEIRALLSHLNSLARTVERSEDLEFVRSKSLFWASHLAAVGEPWPEIEMGGQGLSETDLPASNFEEDHSATENILRQLLIDPSVLSNLDLPTHLRSAARMLLDLAQLDGIQPLASVIGSGYLGFTSCAYPLDHPVRSTLLSEMRKRLIDTGMFRKIDEQDRQPFEIAIQEHAALGSCKLYSFPFFLSPTRRRTWGVIKYGRQRAIGILVHERHHAVSKYFEAFQRLEHLNIKDWLKRLLSAEEEKLLTEAARVWLCDLFENVSNADGKVFSYAGYIFQEVFSSMIRYSHRVDLPAKLSRVLENPIAKATGENLEPIPKSVIESQRNIFLFDPSELQAIKTEAENKGFRCLLIPHGLDIPAGIGFSLPILPWLLQDSIWKKLLRSVQTVIWSNGWPDRFEEAGITLESDEAIRPSILQPLAST